MNTDTNTNVFNKAICLSLTLAGFTINRKGDKSKITTDADKTMVTLNKKILDSSELRAISALDSDIYSFLNWRDGQRSLPFEFKLRSGIYLIPLSLIDEVEQKLAAFAQKRAELVKEFLDAYYSRVEEARKRLGSQFNAKDYPSLSFLQNKFGMKWHLFVFEVP